MMLTCPCPQMANAGGVQADVLQLLREWDIEEAAIALARDGFKKMRTLQQMTDRFPKDICSLMIVRVYS